LYNTEQKETWWDVKINPGLTDEQQGKMWDLIQEYAEIFSDVPTTTHLLKHKIKLTSTEPVYCKPYKLPVQMEKPAEKEIAELERQGWIEPSDAPYASPSVVVRKKNSDEIRL